MYSRGPGWLFPVGWVSQFVLNNPCVSRGWVVYLGGRIGECEGVVTG